MSLFGRIKDAIFGKKASAAPPPRGTESTGAASEDMTMQPGGSAPQPVPQPSTESASVDVEAVLNELAQKSGQKLNWQTSIVDLMKLVGMDSSLAERKELAKELGYDGALDGSAEMNIWLHKRVMRELAANGGKVPASMLD